MRVDVCAQGAAGISLRPRRPLPEALKRHKPMACGNNRAFEKRLLRIFLHAYLSVLGPRVER
eukprot:10525739-Alexandrium_andersonii.AAC.1